MPQTFQASLLQDCVLLAKQFPKRLCVPNSLLLDPGYQRLLAFGLKSDFLPWFSSNVLLLIRDDEISTHLAWGQIAGLEEWNPESVPLCSSKYLVPTQGEKKSALDVISMTFVHFIDPDWLGLAFAGILSQRMRTLKNHKCHLMQLEIKKVKRYSLTSSNMKISIVWPPKYVSLP